MAITQFTIDDLSSSQQPYLTYNELMSFLRAMCYGIVDRDLTAPPGSPSNDQFYIPAATASGDWAGREDDLVWTMDAGSNWYYYTPTEGFLVYIVDENIFAVFDGTNWDDLILTDVQTGYTTSNVTTDRVLDADSTTLDEVADVLCTLIEDLKAKKIISA